MDMDEVRPGMLVIVTSAFPSNADGWDNSWESRMNAAIGKVFRVKQLNSDPTCGVELEDPRERPESESFCGSHTYFPWQVLEEIKGDSE